MSTLNKIKSNKNRKYYITISIATFFIFSFVLIGNLYPQTTGTDKTEIKKETVVETPFTEKYSPGIGIIGGICMPIGKLGGVLDMGFGGQVVADMVLPLDFIRAMEKRVRLNAGYYTLTGTADFTGTISLMPAILSFELSYPMPNGFRPYFSLGVGVTLVTLAGDSGTSKVSDGSSTDMTMVAGIGTGYTLESIPYVEFIADLGFLMAFETEIGQFLNISIGATYRFNTPAGENDEKEPKKNEKT